MEIVDILISLLALVALEVVLGIDNIVFSILRPFGNAMGLQGGGYS